MSLQQEVSALRPERDDYRSRCLQQYEKSLSYKYIKRKISRQAKYSDSVYFMWLRWEAIALLEKENIRLKYSGISVYLTETATQYGIVLSFN